MEDYKQKYDEAFGRAKALYAKGAPDSLHLEEMFPELKESEDEMVRKKVIEVLKLNIDGAESQMRASRGINRTFEVYACNKVISLLEKQGEHTPADNKPKFKVGDWIVTPNNETKQIEKVTFGNYYFTDKTLYNIIDTDNNGHLWTIEDAKDGDVLCYRNDIFLVKSYVLFNRVVSHCTYSERFIPHDIYSFTRADFIKIYPATKEQRDFLFSKIKNAGYEWDAEKKELKKVNTYCQENCKGFQETGRCFCDGECKAKKEHIKQNIQDNDFLRIEQKPAEWSEEDEKMLASFLHKVEVCCLLSNKETVWILKKLKSLKAQPHWKPSDEHMKVLKQWLNEHRYDGNLRYIYAVINSLYEQLKSL